MILDASAVGALLLPDEGGAMRDLVRRAYRETALHVPAIWRTELASIIVSAVRRRRLGPDRVARACATAEVIARAVTIDDGPAINDIAQPALDHGLSAYDATYALLAIKLDAPLLTGDGKLRKAAIALGIPLFA